MPKIDGRGLKCGVNHLLADYGDWLKVDVSVSRAPGAVLRVDAGDWRYLSSDDFGRWRALPGKKTLYVWTDKSPFGRVPMHQVIMGVGSLVDHVNRNGLDNRRKNLRLSTVEQNVWNRGIGRSNSSGVVGVSWRPARRKWQVQIGYRGRLLFLGEFKNFGDAVRVRVEAELKYYGDFAPQGGLL